MSLVGISLVLEQDRRLTRALPGRSVGHLNRLDWSDRGLHQILEKESTKVSRRLKPTLTAASVTSVWQVADDDLHRVGRDAFSRWCSES